MFRSLSARQWYWLLQVAGWSLFFFLELLVYTRDQPITLRMWINALINVGLYIMLTDACRLILVITGALRLRLRSLAVLVLFLVLIVALPVALLNVPLDNWTFEKLRQRVFSGWLFYDYYLHVIKNLLPWFAIYLLYVYQQRMRKYEMARVNLQMHVREQQNRSLRSQLNAHFLFNALNSISTLTVKDPDQARKAIGRLSRLLRRTLDSQEESLIPFADEWSLIEDYLALEKMRYEERLLLHTEIEPAVKSVPVPPMLFQTLVENAIKHGIAQQMNGGELRITAKLVKKHLEIHIYNPGRYEVKEDAQGTGLLNARRRLVLMYGEEAGLMIRNKDNQVITEIRIPA
ncbi:MAG: histidine kinase [Bacteroidia bacterium]|jgi:signal transduction histidine kinase|nr:histidine kinase [Bacteroidia bacterium]